MNIDPYLKLMADKGASDLYFTTGAPVSIKIEGTIRQVNRTPLEPGVVKKIAYAIMSDKQVKDFEETKEMNLGLSVMGTGRYRVNIYYQRGEVSMVIRYIKSIIPGMEELHLPPVLKKLVMEKNGLILVVGSTGSGKSTSLAAMIDHRNGQRDGHILTIEDPIEYTFTHKKSIVGQREVGLDTLNYENALREAMREAPDMIMIGEVRDRHTMDAAITYADTGHLCLTTLHAVNANQALDRIINFFPPEAKQQILMDLSLNLRGVISQRLVTSVNGNRVPAIEVLINTPFIAELIKKGNMSEMKEVMEKGAAVGMQTFDQSLYELYKSGRITLEDALSNADSRGNLEWQINFGGGVKSARGEDDDLQFPGDLMSGSAGQSTSQADDQEDSMDAFGGPVGVVSNAKVKDESVSEPDDLDDLVPVNGPQTEQLQRQVDIDLSEFADDLDDLDDVRAVFEGGGDRQKRRRAAG